ncbi:MAG TPA: hypothetical protein VGK05_06195 [Acidimicrobiia bacterium]
MATAGPPAVDPALVTVNSPQVTEPGNQITFTFTISDVPPCGANEIVSLDSADFVLTDPSGLSTVAGFTTNQPPGTISSNLSPDGTMLTLLFDSAFPCSNATTAPVVIDVTIDVPAGVPLGSILTLDGSFRGFATSTNQDYLVEGQGLALVAESASPSPPPSSTPPATPGDGSGGDAAASGTSVSVTGVTPSAAVATAVRSTARFTG